MDEPSRPPSFQFYPADYLSDSAVEQMALEAQGAYIRLLCHAWLQPEPGILPDDDLALASLSRLGEKWPAHSVAIRRAFRATSREGRQVLVQKRMVEERAAQERRYHQAVLGGHITQRNRRNKLAQLKASSSITPSIAPTPSSSSSTSRDSKDKTSPPTGGDLPSTPRLENSQAAAFALIGAVAGSVDRKGPRAPLMVAVKAQVEAMPAENRNRLHALAGWLVKTGVSDDECVLRIIADAANRMSSIRDLHAYYSKNGAARTTIEGHYRGDQQDNESKRWKEEEWAWLRKFKAAMPET